MPAANVPPPAAASMPVPDPSQTEAAAAPAAPTLGLGPPVPAASVPPAGPPLPASSEPTETVAAAPGAREEGAPTPVGAGTTAASVRPPASTAVPAPASAEPNETAELHSSEPTETAAAVAARPLSARRCSRQPPRRRLRRPRCHYRLPQSQETRPQKMSGEPASPPPAPAPNTATPAAPRLSAAAAPPSGNHDLQEEVAPTQTSSSPKQAVGNALRRCPLAAPTRFSWPPNGVRLRPKPRFGCSGPNSQTSLGGTSRSYAAVILARRASTTASWSAALRQWKRQLECAAD